MIMETLVNKPSSTASGEAICCPEFDPTLWSHKEHEWRDKLFLKAHVPELFHMPLPGTYKKAITKMWKTAELAGAAPGLKDFLLLAYDPSPFKSELYMTITKDIPGEDVVRLSGKFISMVFDGPYNHVPQYMAQMEDYLAGLGTRARKFYFYFAYCPKCAKKYGHNYVVALAQVSD